jgi:anthranilate 1,2-dioxygenase large subunit
MLGQVANTFQTRHIRPAGPDFFELYWTYLGFEDDSPTATLDKLRQANFVGPAGYISLEDGEAGRLVQCGIRGSADQYSIVEMGGRGPIESTDHFATEVAVRGFWSRYHRAMGFTEPADAGQLRP